MTDTIIKKQEREINMLYKANEKQETEIKRLNMIIALKDDENKDLTDIVDELKKENNALKFRNKMLIKTCLNSVYGMYGWKYHFDYMDTDSIKGDKNNDRNY